MKSEAKPGLRPLAGKCVVRPDPKETRRGSIHLPDAHQERPCRGTVLAVGPGKPLARADGSRPAEMILAPVLLKAGDQVCYPWAVGHRLEFAGAEVLVMDQADVLAVIEGE